MKRVTKGNKRITTLKCGCITREQRKGKRWAVMSAFVCASHMGKSVVRLG